MEHQAIYRKWRPTVFEDIVGQNHITKTLKNQIINNKIGHAYLFCGTRGTGKTTCAKVFSRAVNCLDPRDGSPCNECEVCRGILDGSIMDVKEIDAASNNGVDNIREIREDVRYVAANAKYTVYIIDEAHMISTAAFNALLKTLEEPPEHVIFILATTEAHMIPQTILSRCQRFDFKRIKPGDIILRMKEIAHSDGLSISDGAYNMLARLADGSMRDGLSILERVISACGNTINEDDVASALGISPMEAVFGITDAVIAGNVDKILTIINDIVADGKDLKVFTGSLLKHFRDLMICKVSASPEGILDYSAEDLVKIRSQSDRLTFEKISNAVSLLSDADADAKWVKSPRVIYELALIKLARPETDRTPEALMDRLATMESNMGGAPDPAIEQRLSAVEEKLKNGMIAPAPAAEKKPAPKKEKKVSARLFNPIPESELNSDNPIVKIARNWNNISRSIGNAAPFLSGPPLERQITIDADGIILLFERNEQGLYATTRNQKNVLQDAFKKASGSDYAIKIAYKDELEDKLVDFWALKPKENAPAEDASQFDSVDPLDIIEHNFGEIIENTDDSEFVGYSSSEDNFEQSVLEDDREEFLEENELSDENE